MAFQVHFLLQTSFDLKQVQLDLYKYGAATLGKEKRSLTKVGRLRGSVDSDFAPDTLISHD